jgi:hypothetical protein
MACDLSNGGVVRASVYGKWNLVSDLVNSYQFQLVSGGPVSLSQEISDLRTLLEDLYDLVKEFCNVVSVFQGFHAEHLNGNCGTGNVPFTAPIQGALTGDAIPPGVAALISFPTGVRRVVMRKYFGGLDSGVLDADGEIEATAYGDFNAVISYLMSPIVVGARTWRFGYQSPKTSTFEVPFTNVLHTTPAYQRRRRPGTGE